MEGLNTKNCKAYKTLQKSCYIYMVTASTSNNHSHNIISVFINGILRRSNAENYETFL